MSEHHVSDPRIASPNAVLQGAAFYRVHCTCGWSATASTHTLAVEYGTDHRLATHLHERSTR